MPFYLFAAEVTEIIVKHFWGFTHKNRASGRGFLLLIQQFLRNFAVG
jgi:hypothetical protein